MQSLEEIILKFNQLNILVIGDLMLDIYTIGDIYRNSPEAPVPVVNVKSRESRLGGAGNVVKNLRSLGVNTLICSVIGDDLNGQKIIDLISREGIKNSCIIQEKNRITTSKERVISQGKHLVRIDEEIEDSILVSSKETILNFIKNQIHELDIILFQDYDKGVLDQDLIQKVLRLAKKYQVQTVVDPKKKNFSAYFGASLFKPNLKEIKEGINLPTDINLAQLKIAIEKFRKENEFEFVFLTMSEKGVLMNHSGDFFELPAHTRAILDVSGAGDTVIAVAACCLGVGLSAQLIAAIANLAGGLVCEKVGVVSIQKEEIISESKKVLF